MAEAPTNTVSAYTTSGFIAAVAVSEHFDTRTAGTEVAHELHDALQGRCDLLITFASFHHSSALVHACDTLRQTLNPQTTLASSAESVLGGEVELEGLAGLVAFGCAFPAERSVALHPFTLQPDDVQTFTSPQHISEHIGAHNGHRATILLLDPFSVPVGKLVHALTSCRSPQQQPTQIVGGIASGAAQPGHNVLIINDQAFRAGGIGVSLSGDIDVDFTVSQGCRPIGEPMVITSAKENVILELGGRRAFDIVQQLAQSMPEADRQLLSKGLFVGVVIDENKKHHGRGDFLIRNVLGFDQNAGGVAIADIVPVGRTVQLHVRDAQTATEDLELLLDVQELRGPAFGGMLFTCNGRGSRLFDEPNHDVSSIRQRLGEVPIGGFFAGGEIAPIGQRSFVHAHTAALMLMRERTDA